MTVANWPLIAVRIVESIVLMGLVVGAVLAVIVPIVVSAGLGKFSDISTIAEAIVQHAVMILYILGVVAVLLVIMVAIHSFFDGGSARILVDSERADAKATFDLSRFFAGGRDSWWTIFWVYNLIWSVAGIVILIPLTLTIAAMLVTGDTTLRVVAGCAGLFISFVIMVPVAVICGIWTQKAIAVCVARAANASDSMRIAKEQMKSDFGRHFIVAFVLLVISIGGSGVISMLSMPFSMMQPHHPIAVPFFAPMQVVVSLAQSVFSGAIGAWFLACFVSLTEER